jgi:hypothetical protein
MRQNIIEDVWADIFDVVYSTISRYITFLTPFIEKATEEDRPTAEDAAHRQPLKTFKSSFRAAIGRYFFKERFA